MRKVLLTGGAGFVGRHIMKHLLSQDIQLSLVLRNRTHLPILEDAKLESVIYTQDLFAESVDWWSGVLGDFDVVIHAAWYVEPGKYLYAQQNMDCVVGSLNLAMGAAKAGVKRFVGIGTCLEYDLSSGVLSVDTKLNPITPYAAAKASLFLNLSKWLPLHSIEFAWCRLFYLYGEGEDGRRLVPYIHRQLKKSEDVELTNGRQIRDFMDVSEAGRRVAQVATGKHIGPVNICSGNPVTVRQLAEQIADKYGRPDLLKFGAIPERENDPFCVIGRDNLKNNSWSKDES